MLLLLNFMIVIYTCFSFFNILFLFCFGVFFFLLSLRNDDITQL